MTVAPYGSWPSPVSAASLVEQAVSLSSVRVSWVGGTAGVWWDEGRPQERGRNVVVRDGVDVVPAGFSSRARVHEYGGGAYTVRGGTLFFSNEADQRLWRLEAGGGGEPVALTPEDGRARFADADVSPDGRRLACVRERGLVNDLMALPTSGGEPVVLASGHDFYAAPRWSPDGACLAWLSWDHPNMPWDGTDLWLAAADGSDPTHVAGGPDESVSQPRWSPDGVLHWISDRTGWWNLYRADGRPVAPMDADCARPDWVFGQSSYVFLPDGRIVVTWFEDGLSRLGVMGAGAGAALAVPCTDISSLAAGPGRTEVVAIAASGRRSAAVVAIDVDTGAHRTIKEGRAAGVADGAISEARPIEFPTERNRTAHAFYYPPRLEGYEGPAAERPPLLVRSHGGPTSAASPALNPEIQFWTSRGIAVVDVNYGGSSGYGRDYRRRLDGQWGVVDVDDCASAARHLAATGEVDPDRLLVRGGSAGGYTTLCILTFRDDFAAGASYYGVADLEALAADTHKFEARYLDRLIGPYPEARDLYRRRSPLYSADRIAVPVILFQGLEDAVVPPAQAETLAAALRRRKIPFAYVAFEGEQHGFRRAETIVAAFEAELWFYGRVLGFEPADPLDPVPMGGRATVKPQLKMHAKSVDTDHI
ncbi:MAG: S9 family peptidase [Acidimicrobiales bacterium]